MWSAAAERSGDAALDRSLCARSQFRNREMKSKAPSPLRSAGALQSYEDSYR